MDLIDPKSEQKIRHAALRVTRWIGSPLSIALHTILFITAIVLLIRGIFAFDVVILILNTAVSLEAIYLALFIQMTVNMTTETVEDIGEDVEEIQEDIGELQQDVEDISEDVEEMTEEEAQEGVQEEKRKEEQKNTLAQIQTDLRKLMDDINKLKNA